MTKQVYHHDGTGQLLLMSDPWQYGGEILDPVSPTELSAGTVIDLPVGKSTVHPSGDFETYSAAGFIIEPGGKVRPAVPKSKGGLSLVGTPNYAMHPSTEVLCFYYDLKDGLGRRGWMPGTPNPKALLDHVAAGGIFEAWNVTFEFWIWNAVCVPKYGWPPLQLEQCVCVMARSRRHSLPAALGKVAPILGTVEKDKAGEALIRKLCRPNSTTKQRTNPRRTPATDWPDFVALYNYCDKDVETEDEAAARIPDLTPFERETWLVDQRINVRGVQVDTDALAAALDILEQATRRFTMELAQITEGAVGSASEISKIGAWLSEQGVHLAELDADAVKAALKRDDLPGHARRVLEIRKSLSSANVKKLKTIGLLVSPDGRLRDQYVFCGADRTGRWAAWGAQLHNLTAKGPKSAECPECGGIFGAEHSLCPRCPVGVVVPRKDWTVDAVEYAIQDILTRDLDHVIAMWGEPVDVLCGILRGLFVAKQGHDIICCDFSAVEAVVAACLTRCQWRIDVFNTHGKIYEMSASKISGVPFEEMLQYKQDNGMDHPLRKTLGKVAELASGYAGWIGAWKNFGADDFMNDAEMKDAILAWRAESPEIVEMWGGQFRQTGPRLSDGHPELYGLEGAVVAAILNPGECFHYIDISYAVVDDILYCRLPSGRFLHYHRPSLQAEPGKWGKPESYRILFEGYNSNAQKGPIGWHVLDTYGGRLFENVVQAVAADIQAIGMQKLDARGYRTVMHTHDEYSTEVPEGWGSVDEMVSIITERPDWASWWPLRAAGWRHKRYQKD